MPLYLKLLRIYSLPLLASVIVGALLGLIFMASQPQVYDTSLELDINRVSEPNDEYYQYDGFYEIRATNKFAKVVKGWFQTPSFVISVLEKAEKSSQDREISELRNIFTSEQLSSNTVEVRWSSSTQEKAQTLSSAIGEALESKLEIDNRTNFTITPSDPVIKPHSYNPLFFGIGGAALGLLIGIIGAVIWEVRNPHV